MVRDLNDYAKKFEPHDAPKYVSKLLQYNVPNGKKNRGLVLVQAFKNLAQNGDLTEENLRLSQILGWCVELVIMINEIEFLKALYNNPVCYFSYKQYSLLMMTSWMEVSQGVDTSVGIN